MREPSVLFVENRFDYSSTPSAAATTPPTATLTATLTPALAVVINEVAWAGTSASASDEWLELYNSGAADIDLTGWTLSDGGVRRGTLCRKAAWSVEYCRVTIAVWFRTIRTIEK